jgi:hypothetical protein
MYIRENYFSVAMGIFITFLAAVAITWSMPDFW